jgi:hypothetical protein
VSQEYHLKARCWWLTPVIVATWEAEIKRINQPRQIVPETLVSKTVQSKMDGR